MIKKIIKAFNDTHIYLLMLVLAICSRINTIIINDLNANVSQLKDKIVQIEESISESETEMKIEVKTGIDIINKQLENITKNVENITKDVEVIKN